MPLTGTDAPAGVENNYCRIGFPIQRLLLFVFGGQLPPCSPWITQEQQTCFPKHTHGMCFGRPRVRGARFKQRIA